MVRLSKRSHVNVNNLAHYNKTDAELDLLESAYGRHLAAKERERLAMKMARADRTPRRTRPLRTTV